MIKERLLRVIKWVRRFVRETFRSQNEDLPYYITILIAALIFIVTMNSFVELTDDLAENDLTAFDRSVTDFFLSFRSDGLTKYLTFVTQLGDRYAYVIVTLCLAAFYLLKHRSWKFVLQISLVLILASLSNIVLKKAINRARPALEHLVTVNTLSYPSGHAMSAMAFYGFLIFLCARYRMQQWLRVAVITVLLLLILSIGISRIYLGVHYPSDVAGGFIGGLIWVAFCAVVFSLFELLRKGQRRP
jgi:membrane-associated phospholipid phosphatase